MIVTLNKKLHKNNNNNNVIKRNVLYFFYICIILRMWRKLYYHNYIAILFLTRKTLLDVRFSFINQQQTLS